MQKTKLYAKTKKDFLLLLDNFPLKGIWDLDFQISKEIDFCENCNHKLEEDEIFYIKTSNDDLEEYVKHIKNTSSCNTANKDDLKNIEVIYAFKKEEQNIKLYIQRILPSVRAEKNWLFFSNKIVLKNDINIPILNQTHLFWEQKNQKIYFDKFVNLEKIFPTFSKYYRQANETDIKAFKEYKHFKVFENFDTLKFNKSTLRKIAQIVDQLDTVKENFNAYKSYAREYNKDIFKNEKFIINSKDDIDTLHAVVYQTFFSTQIGFTEQRIATAFRAVK